MVNEVNNRVSDALTSLVKLFYPSDQDQDEEAADDRREDVHDLLKSIVEGHEHGQAALPQDIDHVAEQIKEQFREQNEPTEKAVTLSNLVARFRTKPVLSQKCAILDVLRQLASPDPDGSASEERTAAGFGLQPRHANGTERARLQNHSDNMSPDRGGSDPSYRPTRGAPPRNEMQDWPNGRSSAHEAKLMAPGSRNGISSDKVSLEDSRPTEAALLHDLPFMLQGLSTTHLPFTDDSVLNLPPGLPLPLISLLNTLAEPSLLYRDLSKYVQSSDAGLVGQSLRAAVGSELRSYLGLIATLEGEIRRAITSVGGTEARGHQGKVGVTLKRCVVWTREATMGLRLMSLMVEGAKSSKGGQLISMIHAFSTSHGDPFVGAFAERMLVHVTRPFYDMLRQWIYDGELNDPYHEFFVTESDLRDNADREADLRRAPASSVWEDKYKLDSGMIPSIITEDFAKKVFLIGKSLNFIRHGCGDSAWVEAYCKEASRELHYGDTATLETSIDKAYQATMARLIYLMDSKFHLFEHLRALKKYLLLGQGDFIALLMESLATNLDNPAGSQYRHTLTAQLEHAIRGSNAQFDSQDVLRRLDARLVELSHGDVGWDVFTLEYKVDAPVDVVITPWASKQYLVIFNLLWRVKRVEFALGSTWRRCMTGARGVLATVDDRLSRDWKTARCCMAEMIHFVNQLQYYILFEVIEASWDQLQAAITKPECTLDDLIEAHTKYLKAITHKGLLGKSSTGHREDSFTAQLHEILKITLSYKDVVDGLYSFSVAEFTRRQELAAKIETRTAQGQWGLTEKDELESPAPSRNPISNRHSENRTGTESPFPVNPTAGIPGLNSATTSEEQMLPAIRQRLGDLAKDFKGRVNVLLGDLAVQPDVDMKFLGVVMNFNDVYAPRKRRREHRAERDRRTPAVGNVSGMGSTREREAQREGR